MHKLVDTRKIPELNMTFASYSELINYYKNIDQSIFKKYDVYVEKHHIIPRSENGTDNEDNIVKLDYLHHIWAHYLRAKELEELDSFAAYKNYLAVTMMMTVVNGKFKTVLHIDDIELAIIAKEKWVNLQSALFKEAQLTWVTNGKDNTRLPLVAAESFIKDNPEYYKGRVFNNPTGRVWVTNGTERLYLKEEDAIDIIMKKPGWYKGMGAMKKKVFNNSTGTMPPTTLGKKWVHKITDGKTIRKNVLPEEITGYLRDGWLLGTGNRNTNLNKISISKDGKIKNVSKSALDTFLREGWTIGRTLDFKKSCSNARYSYWQKKSQDTSTSLNSKSISG